LELTISNVDGMAFYTRWNLIAPEQEVFDWSVLDAGVNAAIRAGKHFTLAIAAGVYTPQWVYGLGPPQSGSEGIVPIPWDPTYLHYFKGMVAQLGAQYADRPVLPPRGRCYYRAEVMSIVLTRARTTIISVCAFGLGMSRYSINPNLAEPTGRIATCSASAFASKAAYTILHFGGV
jgi:hypothetical protein